MLKCDGLPISPQKRDFLFGGIAPIVFYFPSIENVNKLDFIENPNKRAFNIFGINLKEHYNKSYKAEDYEHFSNVSSIYESENDTLKALENRQKAIEVAKYIDGVKSSRYMGTFLQKCMMYINYKYYQDVINEAKNVLDVVQGDSLANMAFVPAYKFYIGLANLQIKREDEALLWFNESYLDFQSTLDNKRSYIYGCLLNNMANTLSFSGDFDSAYKIAEEACLVGKEQYGENAELYLSALLALSNAEIGLNKSADALGHLEEAVRLSDSINVNLVTIQNMRDKLEILQQKLNTKERLENVMASQSYSDNFWILEVTNDYDSGNYLEAIAKLKDLKDSYEKNFKDIEVWNYISVVTSLSNILCEEGHYIEADKILDESLLFLQHGNVQSNQIKSIYESKGRLYFAINNVDMALQWYNKANDIYKKNGDTKSIQYASLISNVALCFMQYEELSFAKQLLDRADSIYVNFYSKNNNDSSERLMLLNNMATAYSKIKDFSKAKELYERIVTNDSFSNSDRIKSLAYLNLGEIYAFYENNFHLGEEYIFKVLQMDAASYVKDMADVDLYVVHCLTKNANAILEIELYNDRIRNEMADLFAHFTEVEREEYWTQKSQTLVALNNLMAISYDTPQARKMAYDNTLYTKNMLLNSERLLGNMVKECGSNVQDTYVLMQTLKEALVDKRTPNDSISNYLERINQYEKQMIAAIPDFDKRLKSQFGFMDDVKNMLSDNDVAIEFVLIPIIKNPINESITLLGALVLTHYSDAPALVSLCSETDLESLFDSNELSNHEFVDSIYDIQDNRLYQMIWKQIEPYIKEGSSVYYSPTGYINKVNLSTISDGTRRLSDKYDLYEVSTTAMIKSVKQAKNDTHSAVIFGDINYYEDSDTMEANSKKYSSYSSGDLLVTRSTDRGTWDLLPATKDEVNSVESLMKKVNFKVQTFCENEANEESFKALSTHAPDIIHVATHGFYFPSEGDISSSFFQGLNSYTEKDNSMFYSGLLFAGANNTWSGKTIAEGVEDGILTADEISRLDLSGNKLTVLSACETGLGDVDNINGVFGLQRGFKKAGAGSILMSLWKVPDEETQQLMSAFYTHYLSGESAHHALKKAQQQLKGQGKSPYYWAGFVLLD